MRIVLSGGGTAGHITPALALADELQARGIEVRYVGTPNGQEATLVPKAGIDFHGIEASGFNRNHPATAVKAVHQMLTGTTKAKAWLKQIHADAVVCFGGYVCLPVGRAAHRMGIPLIVHEQNSVMGLANKDLARTADAVCLTYGCAAKDVDGIHTVVTGNPVRRAIVEATRQQGRDMLGIPEDARMLLVFGGSLGARHINQAVCAMKDELLAREDLHIVHITGKKDYDSVIEALALTPQQQERYQVMGFQDKMGPTLAAADAVVSRAGASSLAEIAALAVPALLIPFPYATANHQMTNAREYVEAGCAQLLDDDNVETDEFRQMVLRLVDDAELRSKLHEAAASQKAADAAARLADVVLRTAAHTA